MDGRKFKKTTHLKQSNILFEDVVTPAERQNREKRKKNREKRKMRAKKQNRIMGLGVFMKRY